MEKYDLIIVGAGPAGIFTAVELLRHGSKKKMLLVEKGKPVEKRHCPKAEVGHCVNCRPTCAITTGFSGAGAFSDGKLSLSYEVGGDLPTLIGEEFAQELINYTDKIYLEFGADPHVEGIYTGEEIKEIRKNAIHAGLKLVDCPIRHLGTEKAQQLYLAIQNYLADNGVEMLFSTECENIILEDEECKGVLLRQGDGEPRAVYGDTVVIGTGRRQSRLDELAAELGGDFLPLCFDVAKRDVVVEMFANLPEGFKDIDVLLNNAGSSIGQNPAQAGNMDDWDEMIATNINGLLYCTRCVLPGMIERGSGHIVNIGSVAGNRAFKCGNVYGATKAFVNHFSRMLRCDLLGTPVRVTNIKPGHLHTEFLAVRFKGDLKTSEAAYENLDPLTPENIAESVWWSVNLPAHMDVCDMELMPMCQSDGGWSFCHKS